jgi:transposase-like protein
VSFQPRFCPRPDCRAHTARPFLWRRKGTFLRACDGRPVQRYLCLVCRRTFSLQTFRLDYRLKRPALHLALFKDFVSKVTLRQAARTLGCSRGTVARRLLLLGEHCRQFHQGMVLRARGNLGGSFQLDELETFEHSRRLQPLTMPVLIERRSFFVLALETAPLPCRGRLPPALAEKKRALEARHGKRRSGSSAAVRRCLELLAHVHPPAAGVQIQTDGKESYARILGQLFGARLEHARCSSQARRDYRNPLFPINHTLAMLRDGISRLVRRSWAASKLRERLERHAWIWVCWRNYVRGITNRAPRTTPAMALGVTRRRWRKEELLAWKVLPAAGR